MKEQGEIVNRVAKSNIVTIDLADYAPKEECVVYDIKQNLWQEMILKEKDFRAFVSLHDWSIYTEQHVAIHCSVDAIIPSWAYMLLASALEPYAKSVVVGSMSTLKTVLFLQSIQCVNSEELKDKVVVIKGCGDVFVPDAAFAALVSKLQPHVKRIMYGEPCSTVPVFKRKERLGI